MLHHQGVFDLIISMCFIAVLFVVNINLAHLFGISTPLTYDIMEKIRKWGRKTVKCVNNHIAYIKI